MVRSWVRTRLVAALVLALAAGGGIPAFTAHASADARVAPVALPGYKIQSSTVTTDTGAAISVPGYAATGWHSAGPRSTVLAALLAEGLYADPFYSTNLKKIPAADFTVPWWYRSDFTLGTETGLTTVLDFSGMNSGGEVWVNGTKATSGITGLYTRTQLDVTSLVRSGVNTVAFKVSPNDPKKNFTTGWIDWIQTPPDNNMGLTRDVIVRRTGAASLTNAHVVTTLNAALDSAALTIKADVRNNSASSITATVAGTAGGAPFTQDVALTSHQTKTVTFTQTLANPKVWWPFGMGGQPLYDLDLSATVGGVVTDLSHSGFGVRTVTSALDGSGHRAYKINGRPLLVRGGGWSPDMFLRWDLNAVRNKLAYVRDMGLNTVRLEGHLEPDEFFDLTDQMGILVMAGWECCDKWEGQTNGSEPGDTWTAADYPVAKAAMSAEAVRLRDHPSVFTFLIGSDFAPDATQETGYLDALNAADWKTPIIAAASDNSSPQLGSSGMKMAGPYEWIPPNYWYNKKEGGAFGFASEVSAGPDIPTLDSVKRMLSPTEQDTLWQNLTATQYHRSPSSTFNNLKIFNNAIVGRYGTPTSLDDYVRKAQLAQYENVRAQFESFGRNFKDSANPATGVIYWMLNSGWTSLHWQLFDAYLDQGGSYWGTKKAMTPLHVQYSYDNKSVVVVNSTHAARSGLTVKTDVYNTDGTSKYTNTATVTAPADGGKVTAVTIPTISGLSGTYLVKLTLSDGTGEIDRNVYWLSTSADVLDYDNTDWYWTPTTAYANLKGLATMTQVPLTVSATSGSGTTSVTISNNGTKPALFIDAHALDAAGKPVLPVHWSDNEISLWPGEAKTLTADVSAASVRVTGNNSPGQTVSTSGGGTSTVIQSEDATISQGVAESNHTGFTGTGFVNYDNVAGSYVEYKVNAAAAGPASLTLRFANGTTADRPMDISVNGTVVSSALAFAATGNWNTWADKVINVDLAAGVNTIRMTASSAGGGPNADKLTIG